MPYLVGRLGDRVLFQPDDGVTGSELWATDGTAGGTVRLRDIESGRAGSHPADFRFIGSKAYFYARSSEKGREPYVTDGTPAGTVPLGDLNPGAGSSDPTGYVALGNTVLFVAGNAAQGRELWATDGTSAGTRLVKDLFPGTAGGTFTDLVEFNGAVYFVARDSTGAARLWRTDGTEGGTVAVKDVSPSGSASGGVPYLTKAGAHLYFDAYTSTAGTELWRSDGTDAGTYLLKDTTANGSGGEPTRPLELNGDVYFTARGDDLNYDLWTTDGTTDGTALLANFRGTRTTEGPYHFVADPAGGFVYFQADDGVTGHELWRTDGTAAGTRIVLDVQQGATGSRPIRPTMMDGRLHFFADDGVRGQELWSSDGSAAGTRLVAEVSPGPGHALGIQTIPIASGGRLYFSAYTPKAGSEIWSTDGTAAGTAMVRDLNPGFPQGGLGRFVALDGAILFEGNDGVTGTELYKITTAAVEPGTVTGTVYDDLDADGTRDAGEPAMGDVLVYADANGNGTYDAIGESSARTRADGTYELVLPPGQHTVRAKVPIEYAPVPSGASHDLTVTSGANTAGQNFGLAKTTIRGFVFHDLDGDGTRDAAEPGLSGLRVYADLDRNGAYGSADVSELTDGNGSFGFGFVGTGTFEVRVNLPGGVVQTAPANNAARAYTVNRTDGIAAQSFGVKFERTAYKFDFGTASSPVAAGYTRVADTTRYSSTTGFGWTAGTLVPRDRSTPSDPINRDFVMTRDGTFEADLADGSYDVTVVSGDAGYAHDQQAVVLEGAQVASLTVAKNQFLRRTFRVNVTDGRLTLRMRDLGGSDVNTVINALEVAPAAPAAPAEVRVTRSGAAVSDGQSTAVDFGSVQQGAAGPLVTFTVFNDGGTTLTLGQPTLPAGYTLTSGLSASLAPGTSDTFTVRLDTATVGTKGGTLSFATSDADENPFNFPLAGTVTAAPTTAQAPYFAGPIIIAAAGETTIQAEYYDRGGEGVAYHDAEAANTSGLFRTSEGVDFKATTDAGGGYRISDTRLGEWVEYTVDVPTGGTYDLLLRVSNSSAGGRLNVELNGQAWTGTITVPDTDSYSTLTTVTRAGLTLPAGRHVLRLNMQAVAPNGSAAGVNWLRLRRATTTTPTGGRIVGTVHVDLDGDGRRDANENGTGNDRVYLDANDNARLDAGETSVLSGAGGDYEFADLAAGTHRVRLAVDAGEAQTGPAARAPASSRSPAAGASTGRTSASGPSAPTGSPGDSSRTSTPTARSTPPRSASTTPWSTST